MILYCDKDIGAQVQDERMGKTVSVLRDYRTVAMRLLSGVCGR